jgi:hypothetical protein
MVARVGKPMERAIGSGIPVVVRAYDGRTSPGVMDVRAVGPSLRIGRALRALAICWGFALISVLVPFLHWVLVPALALLGPLVAVRAFANDRQVCGGGGSCPACAMPVVFTRSASPEAFHQTCATCRLSLEVVPTVTAGDPRGMEPG